MGAVRFEKHLYVLNRPPPTADRHYALEVQKPCMTFMTLGSWTHTAHPLLRSFWDNPSMSYVLEAGSALQGASDGPALARTKRAFVA